MEPNTPQATPAPLQPQQPSPEQKLYEKEFRLKLFISLLVIIFAFLSITAFQNSHLTSNVLGATIQALLLSPLLFLGAHIVSRGAKPHNTTVARTGDFALRLIAAGFMAFVIGVALFFAFCALLIFGFGGLNRL